MEIYLSLLIGLRFEHRAKIGHLLYHPLDTLHYVQSTYSVGKFSERHNRTGHVRILWPLTPARLTRPLSFVQWNTEILSYTSFTTYSCIFIIRSDFLSSAMLLMLLFLRYTWRRTSVETAKRDIHRLGDDCPKTGTCKPRLPLYLTFVPAVMAGVLHRSCMFYFCPVIADLHVVSSCSSSCFVTNCQFRTRQYLHPILYDNGLNSNLWEHIDEWRESFNSKAIERAVVLRHLCLLIHVGFSYLVNFTRANITALGAMDVDSTYLFLLVMFQGSQGPLSAQRELGGGKVEVGDVPWCFCST